MNLENPVIYLDNAASTRPYPEVIEALARSSYDDFANSSSSHQLGKRCDDKVSAVSHLLLEDLNLEFEKYDVVFTSSATESNQWVIQNLPPDEKIFGFAGDHPSLVAAVENWPNYESRNYYLSAFESSSQLLTLVNSQTGVMPIHWPTRTKKSQHIHLDAVQGYGKIQLNLHNIDFDTVSVCAHKHGGPKGIAALIKKKTVDLEPLLYGGGQQKGLRSSTLPVPLIVAWGEAIKKNKKNLNANLENARQLKKQLSEFFLSLGTGIELPFEFGDWQTSPFILIVVMKKIKSDVVMRFLQEQNIFISSTTACNSKNQKFNSIFQAWELPLEYHKNVLRISLSPETSVDDIAIFQDVFLKTFRSLEALI